MKDNEVNGAGSGAGAGDGATSAPVPATARPAAPAPTARPFHREGQDGGSARGTSMDGYRALPIQSGAKLKATARMINAFNGYLVHALGRPADEMTEADVATLGEILAAVERLEPTKRAYN